MLHDRYPLTMSASGPSVTKATGQMPNRKIIVYAGTSADGFIARSQAVSSIVKSPVERRKHLLARWLNGRRAGRVLAEGLVSARDDVRVRIDLAGSTDHSHHSPQRAECRRIELRRRTQLRTGDAIGRRGRRGRWRRGVEDVVSKHRQAWGVYCGLILVERDDMVGDALVRRQRQRQPVVTVLIDDLEQVCRAR